MKKLFLVDAYALIFRSYYAFIGRPMRNAQGLNTSAIFGFTKFLRDIMKREQPHYLGVAFDPKGGNFRNELYPLYKANRLETPEDITLSVPYIKRILEAMRIPVLEVSGYEADDVIGTLSVKAAKEDFEVYMVTPDKDFGQLIQPSVYIYKQRKSGDGIEIVGREQIKEYYGVDDPKLIIDILALWGDAADNIPGVMGIGEKGAIKLVNQFGSVENILSNIERLSGKQRENIMATSEQLKLSKVLATIDVNVPIEFDPEALVVEHPDCNALREVFTELGFQMFIREMETGGNNFSTINSGSGGRSDGGANGGANSGVNSHSGVGQPSGQSFGQASGQAVASGSVGHSEPTVRRAKPALVGQGSLFGDDMAANDGLEGGDDGSDGTAQGDMFAESSYANASNTPHEYMTIDSAESLRALVAKIGSCERFCFDTETTGFDVFNDRLVGISLSVNEFEAYYVPFNAASAAEYIEILKPLFENENIEKIGQNLKFDIMVLRNAGVYVNGFKIDTMILHYLLDPESRHNMNFLARTYLNYTPIEIESLIGRGAKQLTMDMISVDRVAEYAAEDADVTFRLYKVLWDMVVAQGFERLYRDIEEPLIDVLAEIELAGVKIDARILNDYGKQLSVELAQMEQQIRDVAGDPTLNINSARQLGEMLFVKLKIDDNPKRTKNRQFKTDEEYLQQLSSRHPVVEMILEYRGLKKLLSTYIEALPQLINSKTGRLHASFNQAVTATGRLSSTNPNLQNIPIRDERGRQIRRAFIPADSDHLLLSADYSQVELRLMAHLGQDEALIEAFRNGEDIHTATAARVFGVPLSEVTADQRRKAKTANFGIIYGISAFGLSQRLNIPRTEAKQIIDGYFASYQGVKHYMDNVIAQARADGSVSTIFGRKRTLNDIRSSNAVVRGLAERNAINAPIQGSAADIMKLAMIGVYRGLKENNLKSKVILQVHDELVLDMLKSEQEQVVKIVVDAMEHAAKLSVELSVEYGVGQNWVDAH